MKEQITIKTPEVTKPAVEKGLKENLINEMPPDERLAVAAEKELRKQDAAKDDAKKAQTLKEKILGMFKSKTIAEMKDPAKLQQMLKDDVENLTHITMMASGTGVISSTDGNFKGLIEKYNLDKEKTAIIISELESIKKQLYKMDNGDEKVAKQKEYNNKLFQFTGSLREVINKRIAELG
jgi:hypothetical protein